MRKCWATKSHFTATLYIGRCSSSAWLMMRHYSPLLSIREQHLDGLLRMLIEQGVGLTCLLQRETVSDEMRWPDVLQHVPCHVQTTALGPASAPLRRDAAHLAAD